MFMMMPTLTPDVSVGLACRQQPCLSKYSTRVMHNCIAYLLHFRLICIFALVRLGPSLAIKAAFVSYCSRFSVRRLHIALCIYNNTEHPGQGIEPIFMLLPDRWHRIQLPSSLVPPTVICNNVEAEAGLSLSSNGSSSPVI